MRDFYNNPYGSTVATGEFDSLPGNSQVVIIHGVSVSPEFRGQGYGRLAHLERLAKLFARYLYDVAICTVDESNTPQVKIVTAAGWNKVHVFKSRKTGNLVGIWIKTLGEI
jgi:RimJ/RimL family protein N-acetyltransferase